MKLFKVEVTPAKRNKNSIFLTCDQTYMVWAKNVEQAEDAVYERYKNFGLIVGRKRIKGRIYNARKPIVRMVI